MNPWTKKYAPQKSSDIKGQDSAIKQLQEYVGNFNKHKRSARPIRGASGYGKA